MTPSPFIFADLNPPIDGDPPIATDPYVYTDPFSNVPVADFTWVVIVVVLSCVFGLVAWWFYETRKRVKLEDIRPSVANLSSGEVSLNKAAFMQMLPYMPPLIGISPVLILAREQPVLAFAILIGLVSMPALMYFYMKAKALENNKGKINMMGFLRRKDGTRGKYFFRNVKIKTEKHLTDDELTEIDKAKVSFKEFINEEITKRENKRKKSSLPLEHSKDFYTRDNINSVHAIPIQIDNKHDVYLISRHLDSEWEYVTGDDYDYYGYHEVKITGPELREISTIHRVIELEAGEFRDEYVPVFLVMYDDKMSKDALGAIAPIDVTRDHAIAGMTKAIGAEERTAAGELNSITEQVMVLEEQEKDLDDLSQTIGRKKALDFLNAEKRLTMFNVTMFGQVSTVVAIVFSVIMFVFGYNVGAP